MLQEQFESACSQHACARTLDQQGRLAQPLQHQTKCSYRYFRESEGMFRITLVGIYGYVWDDLGQNF